MDIVIKDRRAGKTTEIILAMLMDDKKYKYIFSHTHSASMSALDTAIKLLKESSIEYKYHAQSYDLEILEYSGDNKTICFRTHEQMNASSLRFQFPYNTSLYVDNIDMFRINNIPLAIITATTKEVLNEIENEYDPDSDHVSDAIGYVLQKPKKSSKRVGIEYNHKSFWK